MSHSGPTRSLPRGANSKPISWAVDSAEEETKVHVKVNAYSSLPHRYGNSRAIRDHTVFVTCHLV